MIVNGESFAFSPGLRVCDVVAQLTGAPDTQGVAVAVNDMVVPRSQWVRTLNEQDVVEVLSAVQGG